MDNKIKSTIIGADHLGLPLKNALIEHLRAKGIDVTDIGVDAEPSVNYPDIAVELAKRISNGEFQRGTLVFGTGIGGNHCQ